MTTTKISSAAPGQPHASQGISSRHAQAAGRHLRAVGHKPGHQQRNHGHHAADYRVAHQYPEGDSLLPAPHYIVAGKDGNGRNGGQNVARQLGLREGEKHDGNQRPQNEKLRKGIAGLAGALLEPAKVAVRHSQTEVRIPSIIARTEITVQGIKASRATTA